MKAKEIVELIISNTACQYSDEWKPDRVYTKDELIKLVESYKPSSAVVGAKESAEDILIEFVPNLKLSEKDYARLIAAFGAYAQSSNATKLSITKEKIEAHFDYAPLDRKELLVEGANYVLSQIQESGLKEREGKAEIIYSRKECLFEYCPNPDPCKIEGKCQNPNNPKP